MKNSKSSTARDIGLAIARETFKLRKCQSYVQLNEEDIAQVAELAIKLYNQRRKTRSSG